MLLYQLDERLNHIINQCVDHPDNIRDLHVKSHTHRQVNHM